MCARRFFRAKIGIVGVNGAGKSTLENRPVLIKYQARLGPLKGRKSAIEQAQLNGDKDVFGNVMEGVAEKQALLERYNELAMNYSDETAEEMASLQDQIDAQLGFGRAGRGHGRRAAGRRFGGTLSGGESASRW